MVKPGSVRRGPIWLVNLDPTIGSEIQKTRPCVVISPPEMHDHLHTVLVAPMTTGSHSAPYRIAVHHAGKNGLILIDQVRAVDKMRLIKRTGALTQTTLNDLLTALRETFEQ